MQGAAILLMAQHHSLPRRPSQSKVRANTLQLFPLQSDVCGSGHRLTHHLHLAQLPTVAAVTSESPFSNQSLPWIKGLGMPRHRGKAQSFNLSLLLILLQRQVKGIASDWLPPAMLQVAEPHPQEHPRSEAAKGGFKPL